MRMPSSLLLLYITALLYTPARFSYEFVEHKTFQLTVPSARGTVYPEATFFFFILFRLLQV